jgi:hypothetical protein
MGVLLGLTRNYARSPHGTRVSDLKPFSRGQKSQHLELLVLKEWWH